MVLDQVIMDAQNGDIESFESIYKSYRDMIFNYVLRQGISRADAEEICNDVFVYVYRNFDQFKCDLRNEP